MTHQAKGRVIGLGSGIAEEHVLQLTAGERGDLCRQQHRGRRRGAEEGVVEGQLQQLRARHLRKFGAPVAHVYTPQPGHAVEQGHPFRVVDVAAFGARDDAAPAERLHQAVVLLCRQVMGQVQLAQARVAGLGFDVPVP